MTKNMIAAAKQQVAALTQQAYEKAAQAGLLKPGAEISGSVDIPKDPTLGDYATSFALAGAKALGQNPRALAQILVDNLDLEESYFDKVEIAGPGFLNFRLNESWYAGVMNAVETEGEAYGTNDSLKG